MFELIFISSPIIILKLLCGTEWYIEAVAGKLFADFITMDESFTFSSDKQKDGESVRPRESKDFSDNEPATCEIATEIYSIVMNTPGFTDEQLLCTLSHLLDNEASGKTFMDLPVSGRVSWIINFLKKHFQP